MKIKKKNYERLFKMKSQPPRFSFRVHVWVDIYVPISLQSASSYEKRILRVR